MRGQTRHYLPNGEVWHMCWIKPFSDAMARSVLQCRTERVDGYSQYRDNEGNFFDAVLYVDRDAAMRQKPRNNRLMQEWFDGPKRVIHGPGLVVFGDEEFMRALDEL